MSTKEGIACPSCGRIIQSDAAWCSYCGSAVNAPTGSVDSPLQNMAEERVAATPHTSNHKGWLVSSLSHRELTDKVIERQWLFMPLVGTSITMIGVIITLYGLLNKENVIEFGLIVYLFGVVVTGGILAQLNFRMLERQVGHANRERILRFRILSYLKEQAAAEDSVTSVQPQLTVIENLNTESKTAERDVPTFKWTVFSYVPFLQLYVLYRMTRFTSNHDRRWTVFMQQVQSGGATIGFSPALPSWKASVPKPVLTYLLVSILFLPFITYWYADLIKDLEEHFRLQWQFEDQMVAEMK